MSKPTRSPVEDLRGASRLAVEATQGITALVEEMHRTIGSGPAVLGRPLAVPARAVTRVVYGGVGGTAGVVGSGIDRALARLTPLLREARPTAEHEAVLAALNGVLGDYLEATDNPLAIPMRLRVDAMPVVLTAGGIAQALPRRTGRLLVTVHGSSMNDRQWHQDGHDLARRLADDGDRTRIDLNYNTGRHISTNGSDLAALLEDLVQHWPGPPLDEIVLLCHSMGGLVARSALAVAEARGLSWRPRVRAVVFLGTPHHGAPLERGGNWVDILLGVSAYSAPLARLGKIRSAGVTDLRHGLLRDEDWLGRDRFVRRPDPRTPLPLPDGVACFAVAGDLGARALPGDGLVPVDSALGRHRRPALDLGFPEGHTWVAEGVSHLGLLRDDAVYGQVRDWLA
jgi:hypothetical protein